MDTPQDIRWKQRFSNYRKALAQLGEAIDVVGKLEVGEAVDKEFMVLLKDGAVYRFQRVYEAVGDVMQAYVSEDGGECCGGLRSCMRELKRMGIIEDCRWEDLIDFNADILNRCGVQDEDYRRIVDCYYPLFQRLEQKIIEVEQVKENIEIKNKKDN